MKKLRKDSLLLQFIGIVIAAVVLIVTSTGILSRIENQILRKNTIAANEKMMEQCCGKIEQFYEDMKHQITAMSYSPTVEDFLNSDNLGRTLNYGEMDNVFTNAMLIQEKILGIVVYDKELDVIANAGKGSQAHTPEEIVKTMNISDILYLKNSDMPYYAITYPIYNLHGDSYDEIIGMAMFMMSADSFADFIEDSRITSGTRMLLIDNEGAVIAERGGTGVEEGDFYRAEHTIKTTGWRLRAVIPREEMLGNIAILKIFTLGAYGLITVILLLLIAFCYFCIIRPIHHLDRFVKRSPEHPDDRMNARSKNELGTLAENLNRMLDEKERMNGEIRESRDRMYEMNLSKTQMELLAYRNQINPHFLYNTLECIRGMALFYDAEDIARITEDLSDVFRYSVKGGGLASIRLELDYIRKYAEIVKFRFGGRITVDIQADEKILEEQVIKMMLQPIVENAVFHGLEPHPGSGVVKIRITELPDNKMKFTISDNGCGISGKKLEEIRSMMDNPLSKGGEGMKSLGIVNVCRRLKLYYGQGLEIKIDSVPDEGTEVVMILPKRQEEWNEGVNR